MQLRFLKYFSVLCEELHYGRAASRLAITQSPLSAAIKSLEDDLGAQLLIRNSKLVQLTPAGSAFLAEANHILDRFADARSLVAAVDHGMHGRLDVGTAASLLYREVPTILSRFRREMPGVEVVLHEMPAARYLQALLRGQIHAAFISGSRTVPALEAIALKQDAFSLCVPERHPLAGRRSVNLREMADERFVMFSRSVAPASHDNVIAAFNQAGIYPQISHRAHSWLTIVAMVAEDGAVALVPKSLARSRLAGVRFISLAGQDAPAPAMLVWNPVQVAPTLAKFIEIATTTINAETPGRRRLKSPRK
ncbi:LysR family transcriptional regulator [Variovorax paradoxus]|uniref:LysR family transcriptional regulator n=1 Tax=Variovorax paradoxus TaxID=34073 RepID=UPI0021ACF6FB|nr:LysR family transcriptional regulator [Variovorax paradoxus]UVH60539.1 LysR family transcriptional regulator [Variovorax paradoxus]